MGEPLDFDDIKATRLGEQSRTIVADLRSYGAAGDEQNAAFQGDCEVVQPLGLLSRPVIADGLEAIVARIGNQDVVLLVQNKKRAQITDLDEGETRLEGAKEVLAMIRIRAVGDIEITPLSGRSVILNGGTLEVARRTDPVGVSAQLATWQGNVITALAAVGQTVSPMAGTTIGNITAGAANVKA